MERLRKGRAQSAVRRDHKGYGARGTGGATTQSTSFGRAVLGPLTNPNLMQAYNYQELMNTAGGTVSTPSMGLNQSN